MIRINLLTVERSRTRRRIGFEPAQKAAAACSVVLLATALGIGWWFWTMRQERAALVQEIALAQTETDRLSGVLDQVRDFETRREQLQQRVALVEQLRQGQGQPVRMLDEVSRAIPEGLWLVEMIQDATGLTIQGRTTTLTALSDLIGNLERSGFFQLPVEMLDSQVEELTQGEVVNFSIRVQFLPPAAPVPATPPATQ
ncbi:MAG: PilN domain-containing protein [Vicinamibacterales bacterium]|jgi:type IV pilus assembly protein PilN|nr:hypothetical protein [Acidobacteriota bacterium]MDP7294189.1 PilN domain-containing protein [Vicinamibacterales bacterium]MDP7471336.1 PilN domain-containing protein [Vicinamibacterales bacterium]MDP7671429.1 PilN domain-containing protein [Vicinamibacterales bacterium]HJO39298.1 PilN domain-containing protein [Vicinamibacterales bacterium]|tara:strand:+ start:6070 stop:6666 length:597 start_codon:yes stop_codon:yes gene_type:complete